MTPGLFTTMRVAAGEAWLWPDHLARLREGAARLGLPAPDEGRLLRDVTTAVAHHPDARVRITLAPAGATVEARPYSPPRRPWRLAPVCVSSAGDAPLLKVTDRVRYEEARRAAADADDALLVAPDGAILETSVANVFFLLPGGRLATPPAAGILPGIARARVLAVAAGLGWRVAEQRLGLAEAAAATACVVTNALFIAHPVAAIPGVGAWISVGLARDLRDLVVRTGPRIRIIQR